MWFNIFRGGMHSAKAKETDTNWQQTTETNKNDKHHVGPETVHTAKHVSKQFVPRSFLARSFSSTRKLQHGADPRDSTNVFETCCKKHNFLRWQHHIFSEAQIIFLTGMWPGCKSWQFCPSFSSWNSGMATCCFRLERNLLYTDVASARCYCLHFCIFPDFCAAVGIKSHQRR